MACVSPAPAETAGAGPASAEPSAAAGPAVDHFASAAIDADAELDAVLGSVPDEVLDGSRVEETGDSFMLHA